MPSFRLHASTGSDQHKTFLYNSDVSTLIDESTGLSVFKQGTKEFVYKKALKICPSVPGHKSKNIRRLRIKLGSGCNFSCSYCLQGNKITSKQIDFIKLLDVLKTILEPTSTATIEFWGGEPLLYWKTLIPFATELRTCFPRVRFATVTNGSLLTIDLVEQLMHLGFYIVVSHDGPGQSVRGPDPLDSPVSASAIKHLYEKYGPEKRVSFNPTLTRKNCSKTKIVEWFIDRIGPDVQISDGRLVGIYSEDSITEEIVFQSREEDIEFRRDKLNFLRGPHASKCTGDAQQMIKFIVSLYDKRNIDTLAQGCGEDLPELLTVDMQGNILTCVNVQAENKNHLGSSHVIGQIVALDKVRLNTAHHWSTRKDCSTCPVLYICAGYCMHLEDKSQEWNAGCNNRYSDSIVTLAALIEALTGFLIHEVEGIGFDVPENRKLIWS